MLTARKPTESTHYVIEGERFHSIQQIVRRAQQLGFDGSEPAMRTRLRSALPLTWDRLAKPVDGFRRNSFVAQQQRGRDEAVEAARATDARRAEIAARTAALETETEE